MTVAGLTLVAAMSGAAPAGFEPPDGEGEWIQLFNGKDLDGWKVKISGHDLGDNALDLFQVKNGVMRVNYDEYENFDGRFGHIFYETPFSHYRIRVEYRFVGEQVPGAPGWAFRNSGVMLHCQSPESMGRDQDFPISVEAQLLGGSGSGERPTANVCTPGTHIVMDDALTKRHCINSRSKTFHGDQWVTVEIEVNGGGAIRHFVGDELVLEYEQPQLDESADAKKLMTGDSPLLESGYISLQAESHPVEFRRVEILPLDPPAEADEADQASP